MSNPIPFIIALFLPALSQAGLLVHEGFDYDLPEGAAIHGVATTATGLTGSYAVSTGGSTGGTAAVYRTTSLAFGPRFPSGGGAMAVTVRGAAKESGSILIGVPLNAGVQTGTIYNSFLVSFASRTAASTASLRINLGATTPGVSASLVANAKHAGATNQSSVDYDRVGAVAAVKATNLTTNVTYLFVNCFTRVGGPGGTATTWVFDLAGYEALAEGGVFSEEVLDLHSFAKIKQGPVPGSCAFDNTRFMQVGSSSGEALGALQSSVFDEIRYGTELADVLSSIPEPSIYAGIAGESKPVDGQAGRPRA